MKTQLLNRQVTTQERHVALGIFSNSSAVKERGEISRVPCIGTTYKVVFPPTVLLR
ncbi:hypothetical protein PDJAM_G00247910 [Pangasius djambal]|uniref:Uncharacterized protein n=1 Tax=Pangasius djambal TaxID=1691987 RepID=A0ACC5YIK6_9TELE|nr:hypothetical protein [Pangasius djambal]